MDIRLSSQKGRTMLEMLSIILIIALLTISALLGLSRLVNKTRANRIIHDGQLVYMDAVSDTENLIKNKNNWMTPSTITESGNPFFYMVDFIGIPYVKVESVQKETCVLLLDMQSDELKFYTTENEEFTTCQENDNALVIDYTGTGLPRECSGYSDCEGAGDTTFCSAQGQCEVCENGRVHNESGHGCKCFDSSDPEKEAELTCSDAQGNTWCCGRNEKYNLTICGSKKGECLESDGACSYQLTLQAQNVSANCSYQLTLQEQKVAANCSYRMTLSTDDTTFEAVQGCSNPGEYCYLAYKDANCAQSTDFSTSGIIYGTCLKRTAANSQCNITEDNTELFTPVKKCSNPGEYCYLAYKDANCAQSTDFSTSEIIYGTCLKRTAANSQCNITEDDTEAFSSLVGCPAGQYCYLKWNDEKCESATSFSTSGIVHGACISRLTNSASCPIQE